MRNLIIIGMFVAAASAAGWFNIQRDGEHTTIDINRAEIRSDARRAIDKGREFLDRRDAANPSYDSSGYDSTGYDPNSPGSQQSYPPAYDPQSYPSTAQPYPASGPYQSQYNDYGPVPNSRPSTAPPFTASPQYNNGPQANYGPYPSYSPQSSGAAANEAPQYGPTRYTPPR
ncbi:hypothetical protein Pla52o_40350 [Novipirellula galeiformis]|uniref:Uncharacterized protein n=1 Tax=Novipirellula galeiformis TaxID=2528004 RepID=A0A5C6C8I6_9BACT|nr:hypothetical protein [Novipirellula galeiformis]TWU21003.1 hypothetical protein Pla52o_40350 [Novipirellula galeiformis]